MSIERICVAAASISVEVVNESIASIYEGKDGKRRLFSEDKAELNMMISENGPKLKHANSVPEASMSSYCSRTKVPSGAMSEDHKTYKKFYCVMKSSVVT